MSSSAGRVFSLHPHPEKSGGPSRAVEEIEVVAQKGTRGNVRYFGRLSHSTVQPSKRQVTLIER